MKLSSANVVVIGVGNLFRNDDGVGCAVIHCLRERPVPGVIFLEETGDGAELLGIWRHTHAAILIDAVQSGAAPGGIYRFDARAQELPAWYSRCSTHSFGVAEAIELARTLGELPARLIVFGVEGLNFSMGDTLSPEVAETVPQVAARIREELGLIGEFAEHDDDSSAQRSTASEALAAASLESIS